MADSFESSSVETAVSEFDIAIIGMSGRFPGANTVDEFWQNLVSGTESITFFDDQTLEKAGVDAETRQNPNYIKASPTLKRHPSQFDAAFFGYSPREAQMIDPQQRLFLECAWEAMEQAGYDAQACNFPVGVFGGSAMNTYFMYSGLIDQFATEYLPTLIGNDNSFLTTRVSYKLNLTGPSLTVQTACSTALVAVHQACQSLLNEESDMALAGGVSVRVPHEAGYYFEEGSVATPDGHCRTFDANAKGTLFGSGAGIVVLKQLGDALDDGDTVFAVIKGSAINNDGSSKIDYTAPSVTTQAEVISEALSAADVSAESISYIEAHGTGTFLGDPIELTALTKAYREETESVQYCAIGSVKSNIGHLDAAAGMAGLIKTVMALQHRQIPASLHFNEPNPQIDFENSPFFVNDALCAWTPIEGYPRRAGITALGIGGTNAHVILEEAPHQEASSPSRKSQLLLLSARSESALSTASANLADHIANHANSSLADMAYTLQTGRKAFKQRRFVVASDHETAVSKLNSTPQNGETAVFDAGQTDIIFMFSGQGAQYVNMARDLMESEPLFADWVDQCAPLANRHLDVDIKSLIFPDAGNEATAQEKLKQTRYTQPALFIIEYALAQLWLAWGLDPQAMVGHSIGEYVAATLAEVFSLEDAIMLVCKRGELMNSLPTGVMMAVLLSEQEVQPYLNGGLSIAVINGEQVCVLAGEETAVAQLEMQLAAAEIQTQRLHTSHAFHSAMMAPILPQFEALVAGVERQVPKRPFVSNVTGTWMREADAIDPAYWANHIRQTVRFYDGVTTLLNLENNQLFIEVGPGNTLAKLVQQHPQRATSQTIIHTLRHPKEQTADDAFLLQQLGQVWLAGAEIDWESFYEDERRLRVPLPTYPFERKRFWFEEKTSPAAQKSSRRTNLDDWFAVPTWQRVPLVTQTAVSPQSWLLFLDEIGVGKQLAEQLIAAGHHVMTVQEGERFETVSTDSFTVAALKKESIAQLWASLEESSQFPNVIIHCGLITADITPPIQSQTAFFKLLALSQALDDFVEAQPHLLMLGNHLANLFGDEIVDPSKAMLSGAMGVMSKELGIPARFMDVDEEAPVERLLAAILAETAVPHATQFVAYRRGQRWQRHFEKIVLPASKNSLLKDGGTYLISGGFGGVGATFARHLAATRQANLILISRSPVLAHDLEDNPKAALMHQLVELGATVLPLAVDVTDREGMETAVSQAVAQFGQIDGILHTAGCIDDQLLVQKSVASAQNVLSAKVQGTRVIHDLAAELNPDFVVLFSSINAILAPGGQVDYSAANAFMDAFAEQQNLTAETNTISINWPGWQAVGMLAQLPPSDWQAAALARGIAPQEGVEAFERALALGAPQVLVSPEPFEITPVQVTETAGVNEAAPAVTTADLADMTEEPAYETETQAKLAKLWEAFLGVERPLPDDDYFELGGSSLIALRMLSKIEKQFGIKLRLNSLMDAPTLRELAALLE